MCQLTCQQENCYSSSSQYSDRVADWQQRRLEPVGAIRSQVSQRARSTIIEVRVYAQLLRRHGRQHSAVNLRFIWNQSSACGITTVRRASFTRKLSRSRVIGSRDIGHSTEHVADLPRNRDPYEQTPRNIAVGPSAQCPSRRACIWPGWPRRVAPSPFPFYLFLFISSTFVVDSPVFFRLLRLGPESTTLYNNTGMFFSAKLTSLSNSNSRQAPGLARPSHCHARTLHQQVMSLGVFGFST